MAKKPLFLAFADAHVVERIWAHRPIQGDAMYGVRQVFSLAQERNFPWVIGAGDLLDSRSNRSAPICFWQSLLSSVDGIKFGYVQGNHEYDNPPWLSGSPEAFHLHKRVVSLGGLRIYGLDFQPQGVLQQELDEVPPGTDVLIAHQAWLDMSRPGTSVQGQFADVPVVRMMVTGDLHKHQALQTVGKDHQRLTVLSPGSTTMTAIDNQPEQLVYLIYDDLSYESVQLKSRPYLQSPVLGSEEELSQFLKRLPVILEKAWQRSSDMALPEEIRKPLLRIRYSPLLTEAHDQLTKAAGDRAHLHWKEILPDSLANPREDDQIPEAFETVEEALAEYVRERPPHIAEDLLALVGSTDLSSTVEQIENRFFERLRRYNSSVA